MSTSSTRFYLPPSQIKTYITELYPVTLHDVKIQDRINLLTFPEITSKI